jgi:hypothetical protein
MVTRVFAVSGAQCTGKSTLLDSLSKVYHVDDLKVARWAISEIGKPLYEINQDVDLTIHFQEKILAKKIENDSKLRELTDTTVFVERCFADIYAYAETWSAHFKHQRQKDKYDKWLKTFHQQCLSWMSLYDGVIFIPSGKFDHVDDGVRAKADTQDEISNSIRSMITRHWGLANFAKPQFYVHELEEVDIMLRMREVERALASAEEYFKLASFLRM